MVFNWQIFRTLHHVLKKNNLILKDERVLFKVNNNSLNLLLQNLLHFWHDFYKENMFLSLQIISGFLENKLNVI